MSRRQKVRGSRTATFWSDKFAKARGDARATVGVRFDLLRARVDDLPSGLQRQAWADADAAIRGLLDDVTAVLRGGARQ